MSDPTDTEPTINMVSPDGDVRAVTASQAKALPSGWTVQSDTARAAQVTGEQRSAETPGIVSLGQGAFSGGTLGIGPAIVRAIGGDKAAIAMRHVAEAHPNYDLAGNLAGGLLVGGAVGKLGSAVSGALGDGILGSVAGGVAEGSAYGAGSGLTQLAQSTDPIDAEHVSSTIGTGMLLGGGIGGVFGGAIGIGRAATRALGRAGEAMSDAASAKAALSGVPEDLAGADLPTLRAAKSAEDTATKAAAETEARSLEDLRKPQREELAAQIKELHNDLKTERPISKALQGDDVLAIPGIKSLQVDLAKSFTNLGEVTRGTTALAENPTMALKGLQLRADTYAALEPRIPELLATLGSDARAAGLAHVSDALAETNNQIAAIKQLDSKMNPVSGQRLTELRSGITQRGTQIQGAIDALGSHPEAGILQKTAQAATFGGVTALAHAIPGVGIAAPFLGAGASKLVGRLFEHLAGNGAAVAEKSAAAAQAFLGGASKVAAVAPMVASKILAAAKFGAGPDAKSSSMVDQFHRVSAELRAQTMYAPDGSVQMRPDVRQALAARLAPIGAVNPVLADKIETNKAAVVAFISSKIPRQPDSGGIQIGPDTWRPSDLAIRSFARTLRAAEDPASVEESLATSGLVTPEAADAYRTCYPARFAAFQQSIMSELPKLSKTLPMAKKIGLSVFSGVPLIPALQPNVLQVLQGNFASEPGTAGGTQAPKPMPQFGALGTPKSIDKPTPSQQLGG